VSSVKFALQMSRVKLAEGQASGEVGGQVGGGRERGLPQKERWEGEKRTWKDDVDVCWSGLVVDGPVSDGHHWDWGLGTGRAGPKCPGLSGSNLGTVYKF